MTSNDIVGLIITSLLGLIMIVMAICLLLGKVAFLIAGYNTASKEEKSKYNTKKLCRVVGAGILIITLMILAMGIWETVLPASFATVFLVVTVTDCIVIIILANTICRR